MFEFNGFDPKQMTDDELLMKSVDLARKSNWASRFGSGAAEQLQNMVRMIANEQRERSFMQTWNLSKGYFVQPIESDPEMNTVGNTAIEPEVEKPVARPKFQRRTAPTPTRMPVAPINPSAATKDAKDE